MALAYGLLTFSQPLSLIIFGPIPCLYILVFSKPGKRILYSIAGGIAGLLGVASGSIYLIPALINRQYVTQENFINNKFYYASTFLDFHALLASFILLLPLLGFFVELPQSVRKQTFKNYVGFWICVLCGLLFMTLPPSAFLWEHVPLLQYIQGTTRFFLAMVPAVVFIAASWLPYVKTKVLYPAFFVFGWLIASAYTANTFFFESKKPIASILDNHILPSINNFNFQTTWMVQRDISFTTDIPAHYKTLEPVSFTSGIGSASITSQSQSQIHIVANIQSPEAKLLIKRLYFPGWSSDSDSITVHEQNALLSVELPEGKHNITLFIPWYEGEYAGFIISLIAISIILSFTLHIRQLER